MECGLCEFISSFCILHMEYMDVILTLSLFARKTERTEEEEKNDPAKDIR